MLLTGLNIDCLEEILEYLELRDLLNVADSNKRLRHASKFVFVRKYGSYGFRLYDRSNTQEESITIYNHTRSIHVRNLKLSLPLLRNFWPFISRIVYQEYEESLGMAPRSYYIIDYINDFCSETLNHLQMILMHRDLLDYFKNPFTRVKTVGVLTGYSTQKNSLVRLFPKMEKLTVKMMNNNEQNEFVRSECIANHFPFLEYFQMFSALESQYKSDNEYIEVFKDFFRLNPQLKHLKIKCIDQAEVKILQVFEERKQNPERLELMVGDNFFNCFNRKRLYSKNVKHLLIRHYSEKPLMEEIPIMCNQLETFEIYFSVRQHYEDTYDFCRNNSSIRKLTLGNFGRIYVDKMINFSRLAQCLPLLEEFTNWDGELSVDEALHVFSAFKCLRYFCFCCPDQFACKVLLSRLSDNWTMHFTTDRIRNYVTFKL